MNIRTYQGNPQHSRFSANKSIPSNTTVTITMHLLSISFPFSFVGLASIVKSEEHSGVSGLFSLHRSAAGTIARGFAGMSLIMESNWKSLVAQISRK